jgi:hypothetical protein
MGKESIPLIVFEWFLQYLEGTLRLPFPSDVCPFLWALDSEASGTHRGSSFEYIFFGGHPETFYPDSDF